MWVADIHFILFLVSIYRHRFLTNKASSDDNSVAIVGAIVAENGDRFGVETVDEALFTGLRLSEMITVTHFSPLCGIKQNSNL